MLQLIVELLLRIQVPPSSAAVQLLNEGSSWPMCRIDELNVIQSKQISLFWLQDFNQKLSEEL